jgi:DNA-3-methyladenine glycosylase I
MYRYIIPPRAVPRSDRRYMEILAQAVFQAGFSWEVVRSKWPGVRRAFRNFDLDAVARLGPGDAARILSDPGVVRNRRKVAATIENARILRALARRHGSVRAYVASLRPLPYGEKVGVLSRTFRFLGPTGVYFFLWCAGEDVPEWEERVP